MKSVITSLNSHHKLTVHFTAVVAGITSVAFALPAQAVEISATKPDSAKACAHTSASGEATKKVPCAQLERAFLGLGGAPVSKTLALHLNLEKGTGITLLHVSPDSAAAAAGLQPHDILISFDAKKVGSQLDVRDVISAHKPGDQVAIEFICKGQRKKASVTLGSRPAHMNTAIDGQGVNPGWMFKGLGAQVPEIERLRMRKQIESHIERLRTEFQQAGPEGVPKNEAGKPLGKKIELGGQFNASSSLTMSDGEGSIILNSRNGTRVVIVKDKQGKVVFKGPYNTPKDTASLPDEIRKRVSDLNIEELVIHLHVDPKTKK